ncbi:choloylglycine hydrolase family protein [Enterococcus sp. DIV0212c]|uniref:choloylglycine hydrolase family protein n=1 Tax=Enterococcus sp. DIV0212c TaxID=2230867 RepID=UPI0035C79B0C
MATKDQTVLLARTMDFAVILDAEPTFIPRKKLVFANDASDDRKNDYAFVGMARQLDSGEFIFADGLNEKGLSCAALYFSGYAEYNSQDKEKQYTLAPHDVVPFLLSTCTTIDEVTQKMEKIQIENTVLDFIGIVLPLHWIVTDHTGESIVIEYTEETLHIYENEIGVMTNSPDYTWHTTNLRNYIGLQPEQKTEVHLKNMIMKPFGEGAGAFGLPGDFTPPSRFVRAAFLKSCLQDIQTELDGVNAMFHILANVDIPKGVVKTTQAYDYTQYTSVMVNSSLNYYYKTYNNQRIRCIQLGNEDFDATTGKIWSSGDSEDILYRNNKK